MASRCILVVDDSATTRRRLCALIEEHTAFEVACCPADFDIALTLRDQLAPVGVVIDVPFNDERGVALLRELRDRDPDCLLVVLSNQASQELKERSLAIGADHYLRKAIEFERVIDLVRPLEERS